MRPFSVFHFIVDGVGQFTDSIYLYRYNTKAEFKAT